MSYIQYPNPTPIFPALPVVGFPVHKKPLFTGWQHKSVTGREYLTARQVYPNWDFELQFSKDSWLREQTQNNPLYTPNSPHVEFEAISQLFLSCYGTYGEFYYDDPEDDSRLGQPIAIGDGMTTTFLVLRTWGFTPLARVEPVGGVNFGQAINVYFNGGSPISPLFYSVTNDPSGSHLNFSTAPEAGVVITMDFSFFYRCRWKDDMQEYQQFNYNLWELGKCEFKSTKP